MTKVEMAKYLTSLQEKENFLREAGQKEYAHDEQNAFANFERVGAMLDINPKKVLLVYFLKHIDGIIAAANGHESQREPVEGRILDARVYLALLGGMFQEDSAPWEKVMREKHRDMTQSLAFDKIEGGENPANFL